MIHQLSAGVTGYPVSTFMSGNIIGIQRIHSICMKCYRLFYFRHFHAVILIISLIALKTVCLYRYSGNTGIRICYRIMQYCRFVGPIPVHRLKHNFRRICIHITYHNIRISYCSGYCFNKAPVFP